MTKDFLKGHLLAGFVFLGFLTTGCSSSSDSVLLVKGRKAQVVIGLPPNSSVTERFAATELSKYLRQMTGAVFMIDSGRGMTSPEIKLMISKDFAKESYTLNIQGHDIILTGGSGRAILYAVYDLLGRLGCRWIAPEFSFYKGHGEYIPHKTTLSFRIPHPIEEAPGFAYRKLDVEEGRTHNLSNLKQIIDWMPKLRFNTLMIPLDYGGTGRVKWDKWRKALTPELKKRGLIIEVGGHGYQNFLNAGMTVAGAGGKGPTLFKLHPEWFGKDKNCDPSPAEYIVFNSSNPAAVNYLIGNVVKYLNGHPEIDIFDFWPPDGARWAECPSFLALGDFQDRQARLANQVDSAIKTIRPDLQLEIIAYARALMPPQKVSLDKDILVDFCPINQSFENQIDDSSNEHNATYVNAIHAWRKRFSGNIGLYSYYRKYAWRSLPNIIPHYMQRDMQWYASVPLQGISIYSEPGDWGTYELNYYTLGHLAWDPDCNVDSLINQFGYVRYDSAWKTIKKAYRSLEQLVRTDGSIPNTRLKSPKEIFQAEKELSGRISEVNTVKQNAHEAALSANLSRLLLMLQYADDDLKIQYSLASHNAQEVLRKKIKELVAFLESNRDKGVFVLSANNNLTSYSRHYGIKAP
jgi:hypothetical protein